MNFDGVGERHECHLEAVRRLVSADDQRLDDAADELDNALEVVSLDAAGRVQRENDVHAAQPGARYTHDVGVTRSHCYTGS